MYRHPAFCGSTDSTVGSICLSDQPTGESFFFPCCDHRPERSCVIAAEAYLLPLTRLSRCHSQLYNQARNNQAEELYP